MHNAPIQGTPIAPISRARRLFGTWNSAPAETALGRYKRLIEEAMIAADEARAEVGEIAAHHLSMQADENTSDLFQLLEDLEDKLSEDEDAEREEARAYERQIRSDYYAGLGLR